MDKITMHGVGSKLAWAAYMTHCLLDGIELNLSDEDKLRLSGQAKEYEKYGVEVAKHGVMLEKNVMLPCTHCGCEGETFLEVVISKEGDTDSKVVKCWGCGAIGPYGASTEEAAIEEWNRRKNK